MRNNRGPAGFDVKGNRAISCIVLEVGLKYSKIISEKSLRVWPADRHSVGQVAAAIQADQFCARNAPVRQSRHEACRYRFVFCLHLGTDGRSRRVPWH
jgi:hypothetical protein